jgi:molecular chaperone HscB
MQNPAGKNYFELFDLPVTFEVDAVQLADRYRELQRKIHPDRFASATDQERRLSVQMTALVNEAFQTLKDPLRRGRYLLGLQGVDTGEDTDTAMEPGFLMEQMELREALGEAAGDGEALVTLAQTIQQRLDERVQKLAQLFREQTDDSLGQARNLVREMQFFSKLLREVEAEEEDIA